MKHLSNHIALTFLFALAMLLANCGGRYLYDSELVLATGIHSYLNRNYDEAIRNLELATSNPHRLNSEEQAEAYCYLAKSYYAAHKEGSSVKQTDDILLKMHESYGNSTAAADKAEIPPEVAKYRLPFAEALYEEGLRIYEAKLYQKAYSYFTSSSELDKKQYKAYIMLGFIHFVLDDIGQSIRSFEEGIHYFHSNPLNRPGQRLQSAYYSLATLYLDEGEPENALNVVNDGIALFPSDEDLHRVRLACYQDLPDRPQEAIRVIKEFEKQFGKDQETEALHAAMLIREGSVKQGLAMCHAILRNNPNHVNSLQQIASYYINEASRYQDAFAHTYNLRQESTLESLVADNMIKALPYLHRLQSIDPGNMQWEHYIKTAEFYLSE